MSNCVSLKITSRSDSHLPARVTTSIETKKPNYLSFSTRSRKRQNVSPRLDPKAQLRKRSAVYGGDGIWSVDSQENR